MGALELTVETLREEWRDGRYHDGDERYALFAAYRDAMTHPTPLARRLAISLMQHAARIAPAIFVSMPYHRYASPSSGSFKISKNTLSGSYVE